MIESVLAQTISNFMGFVKGAGNFYYKHKHYNNGRKERVIKEKKRTKKEIG